jgi:acid phosphatase
MSAIFKKRAILFSAFLWIVLCLGPGNIFPEPLRFIAVGDVGHNPKGQEQVAAAMAKKDADEPAAFVLLLGDCFSSFGVVSAEDPQFISKFEKAYPPLYFNVPFYPVLGNHDSYGNADAFVKYSQKSSRWKMPGKYYAFIVKGEGFTAAFFALDTHAMVYDENALKKQLEWLEKELSASKAEWKIVFTHYPVYSYGYHGETGVLVKKLAPLLEKHNVDLYLCGHDHHMQFIHKGKVHYLVCGTGSTIRQPGRGTDVLFNTAQLGFAFFNVTADALAFQLIATDHTVLFEQKIDKK